MTIVCVVFNSLIVLVISQMVFDDVVSIGKKRLLDPDVRMSEGG